MVNAILIIAILIIASLIVWQAFKADKAKHETSLMIARANAIALSNAMKRG